VNWMVVDDERSSSLIKGIRVGVLAPGVSATKTLHLFNTGAGGDRMVDISVQTRTANSHQDHGDEDEEEGDDDKDDDGDDQQGSLHDMMEHLKMLIVPTVNPIRTSHDIVYRRSLDPWPGLADLQTFEESFWDVRRGGEALVNVTMSCVGPWGLSIESVVLERTDNVHARIIESSTDVVDECPSEFPEYIGGDEFRASSRISFALDDNQDPTHDAIEGPGRYVITWHRVLQDGELGSETVTYFPIPSLRPPMGDLVALLDVPPRATLHVPISLTLTIRNYHPTRSANITIHLEPDSLDAFVVSGLRNGRVPVLLPGSEEKLVWRMLPIECGYVKIPRIKVIDRRKAIPASQNSGEPEAPADASAGDLDVRRDSRRAVGPRADSEAVLPEELGSEEGQEGADTILVLP